MSEITFSVRGIPAPGGSKKGFYSKKTNRVVIVDDAKRNADWRASVAHCASYEHKGAPFKGPLAVYVEFTMPRIKGHFNSKGLLRPNAPLQHTKKPDATKLMRSTEDALTGILWDDDAQISMQVITKVYGAESGAVIRVLQLNEEGFSLEPQADQAAPNSPAAR